MSLVRTLALVYLVFTLLTTASSMSYVVSNPNLSNTDKAIAVVMWGINNPNANDDYFAASLQAWRLSSSENQSSGGENQIGPQLPIQITSLPDIVTKFALMTVVISGLSLLFNLMLIYMISEWISALILKIQIEQRRHIAAIILTAVIYFVLTQGTAFFVVLNMVGII